MTKIFFYVGTIVPGCSSFYSSTLNYITQQLLHYFVIIFLASESTWDLLWSKVLTLPWSIFSLSYLLDQVVCKPDQSSIENELVFLISTRWSAAKIFFVGSLPINFLLNLYLNCGPPGLWNSDLDCSATTVLLDYNKCCRQEKTSCNFFLCKVFWPN